MGLSSSRPTTISSCILRPPASCRPASPTRRHEESCWRASARAVTRSSRAERQALDRTSGESWGRKVASSDGFVDSDALRASRAKLDRGRWTAAALRDYIASPGAFAPGTTMELTVTYSEPQISDLVAYLETLR